MKSTSALVLYLFCSILLTACADPDIAIVLSIPTDLPSETVIPDISGGSSIGR